MDLELDLHSPTGHGEPGETVIDVDEPEPNKEPLAPPTRAPSPTGRKPTPEPLPMDPYTASLYERVDAEDFVTHRRRFEQQETMSFGPVRNRPADHRPVGPYSPCKLFYR